MFNNSSDSSKKADFTKSVSPDSPEELDLNLIKESRTMQKISRSLDVFDDYEKFVSTVKTQ